MWGCSPGAHADDLLVAHDHAFIQVAIDKGKQGDRVLVTAGTHRERLILKPGVTVRRAGDDAKGKLGLKRAEATMLDHPKGKGPG